MDKKVADMKGDENYFEIGCNLDGELEGINREQIGRHIILLTKLRSSNVGPLKVEIKYCHKFCRKVGGAKFRSNLPNLCESIVIMFGYHSTGNLLT